MLRSMAKDWLNALFLFLLMVVKSFVLAVVSDHVLEKGIKNDSI